MCVSAFCACGSALYSIPCRMWNCAGEAFGKISTILVDELPSPVIEKHTLIIGTHPETSYVEFDIYFIVI